MSSEVAKELEETLLRWKGVEAQRTPGRTTFTIQGALFSFLTKNGVVVKHQGMCECGPDGSLCMSLP